MLPGCPRPTLPRVVSSLQTRVQVPVDCQRHRNVHLGGVSCYQTGLIFEHHLLPSLVAVHPLTLDCDERFHRAPSIMMMSPSRWIILPTRQADVAQTAEARKSLQRGLPPCHHRGLQPLPELVGGRGAGKLDVGGAGTQPGHRDGSRVKTQER